ncbi:hypothetical protein D3C79_908340 [compost metagenome]
MFPFLALNQMVLVLVGFEPAGAIPTPYQDLSWMFDKVSLAPSPVPPNKPLPFPVVAVWKRIPWLETGKERLPVMLPPDFGTTLASVAVA